MIHFFLVTAAWVKRQVWVSLGSSCQVLTRNAEEQRDLLVSWSQGFQLSMGVPFLDCDHVCTKSMASAIHGTHVSSKTHVLIRTDFVFTLRLYTAVSSEAKRRDQITAMTLTENLFWCRNYLQSR